MSQNVAVTPLVKGSEMADGDYLARACARLTEEALEEVERAHNQIMIENSRHGRLESSTTLIQFKREAERVVREAGQKMVRRAADTEGASASGMVRAHLMRCLDAISDVLAERYRKATWGQGLEQRLGNEFLETSQKEIDAIIDDFEHGFLSGEKLASDPVISIVSQITNSPGAVQQSGIGNVQTGIDSSAAADLRAELESFLRSQELQRLDAVERAAAKDLAETLRDELCKPSPDPGKVARWGKRLLAFAEKVGVASAVTGISRLLFPA